MENINSKRLFVLRREMEARNVDCCIIFTADEHCSEYIDSHYKFREYISGFTGSAGTLIVTMDEAYIWTDGRYFIQAEKELDGSGIMLKKSGEEGVENMHEYLRAFVKRANKGKRCISIATDFKLISSSAYGRLMKMADDEGCTVKDIDFAGIIWKDRPALNKKKVYCLPLSVSGKDRKEKLADIRKSLVDKKADAVIISGLSDVMWVYNIRGNDILYNPVAVSYGYIDDHHANLFVQNGCCSDELKQELLNDGINVRDYDDFDNSLKKLKGKRILYDPVTLNAHVYELLDGNDLIRSNTFEYIKKHIKNPVECELARKWHVEDGLAVTRFIYRIKKLVSSEDSVITEYEAAMMIDDMRREINGNLGLSFETISAYGSNGAIIHYSPSENKCAVLGKEGFLLVDSGGQYEGATTDITRTIALGKLTDEMKYDYTTVLKGVIDLADAVFLEGTRGENLDILARRPIWNRFLDYRHGTGHGVGAQLSVHEGPQAFRYKISKDNIQPELVPGMITSDEPGIYLEGKYGIRIENLLLCSEKHSNEWGRFLGFDTLTLVPYERDAIIPEMLTQRQRNLINDYHSKIFNAYANRLSKEERDWLKEVTSDI